MKALFEELDFRPTPLGDLILRRRRMTMLENRVVYEVLLGEGYLMSSLFHEVEEALADLGLQAAHGTNLNVVVGGLGLGYTAVAALRDKRLGSLLVVEALAPVIEWHQKELVPLGEMLNSDPRCRLVHGDFFALAAAPECGFDPEKRGRQFDVILLDIDHSPRNLLDPNNANFYTKTGLQRFALNLVPGGIFAMWSDDPPDEAFERMLSSVFASHETHVVKFYNPLLDKQSASTVYVASTV